jgi:hypothetical protein
MYFVTCKFKCPLPTERAFFLPDASQSRAAKGSTVAEKINDETAPPAIFV